MNGVVVIMNNNNIKITELEHKLNYEFNKQTNKSMDYN